MAGMLIATNMPSLTGRFYRGNPGYKCAIPADDHCWSNPGLAKPDGRAFAGEIRSYKYAIPSRYHCRRNQGPVNTRHRQSGRRGAFRILSSPLLTGRLNHVKSKCWEGTCLIWKHVRVAVRGKPLHQAKFATQAVSLPPSSRDEIFVAINIAIITPSRQGRYQKNHDITHKPGNVPVNLPRFL